MEDEKQFWMVWCPTGSTPVVRHESIEAATNEAERLARKCQSVKFYVLEAVALRVVDGMQRISLRSDALKVEELPF